MAQKYTLSDSTTAFDRVSITSDVIQLSDGTFVFLYRTSASGATLAWTSDRTTVNTIATGLSAGVEWKGLARDASDNIYFVYNATTSITVQAFTKGTGHTWTPGTAVVIATSGLGVSEGNLFWCNTGGGTGGKGHLLYLVNTSSSNSCAWWSFDVGALLAGTMTAATDHNSGSAMQANTTASQPLVSLHAAADGFGATSGLWAGSAYAGTTTGHVARWSINSSGLITVLGLTSVTWPSSTITKLRVIRYAAGQFAIIGGNATDGTWVGFVFSSGTYVGNVGAFPAGTGIVTVGGAADWDCFKDPITANKVWLLAANAGTGQVFALPLTMTSTSGTWGTTATVKDTLSPITNGSATPSLVAVTSPVTSTVDFLFYGNGSSSTDYLAYGDAISFASAPAAPTLVSPGSGAYIDTSAGVSFQAVYHSTDAANANAYALRIKTGTGSYSYWNASTTAWQSTIVWNSCSVAEGGTLTSSVAASTTTANGQTYNWSVAFQEAIQNLQGNFAADATFNAQAALAVTITNPVDGGTVTDTSRPTVNWTTSGTAAQTGYQVVVESGTYGSSPGSGTTAWDSTVVTSTSQLAQVAVDLTNDTTYRAFVQVTQTGGQTSAWTHTTFTLSLTPPATPALSAVLRTDTTGAPYAQLTVTGSDSGPTFTYANTTVQLDYSDDAGATWTTLRGCDALTMSSSDTASAVDYELTPGTARTYRATIVGTTGGNTIASTPATSVAITAARSDWFLESYATGGAAPTTILKLTVLAVGTVTHEQSTAHYALGRPQPVVISDVVNAGSGTLALRLFSKADGDALKSLSDSQAVLWLVSPYDGESRWVRIGPPGPTGGGGQANAVRSTSLQVSSASQPVRDVSITWVETDRPTS